MQQQSLKVGPGGGGRKFNRTLKDLYYINKDKMHTEFDAPWLFLIFNTYFFKANNIANFRPDFCKSPPRGERVRRRRRSKISFSCTGVSYARRVQHLYSPKREEERNKNRLSSTTCSEELQKIFKDWQSFKGFCQKAPKNSLILSDLRF